MWKTICTCGATLLPPNAGDADQACIVCGARHSLEQDASCLRSSPSLSSSISCPYCESPIPFTPIGDASLILTCPACGDRFCVLGPADTLRPRTPARYVWEILLIFGGGGLGLGIHFYGHLIRGPLVIITSCTSLAVLVAVIAGIRLLFTGRWPYYKVIAWNCPFCKRKTRGDVPRSGETINCDRCRKAIIG